MENQRMQKGNMAARNNRAMQSSEVFIRLDISMLNSYDMMLVREKYGIEGWGVVVFIMKYLIERRTDCRAPLYAVNEIARICHKRKKQCAAAYHGVSFTLWNWSQRKDIF